MLITDLSKHNVIYIRQVRVNHLVWTLEYMGKFFNDGSMTKKFQILKVQEGLGREVCVIYERRNPSICREIRRKADSRLDSRINIFWSKIMTSDPVYGKSEKIHMRFDIGSGLLSFAIETAYHSKQNRMWHRLVLILPDVLVRSYRHQHDPLFFRVARK